MLYIITGPQGCGKTLNSDLLATHLNCRFVVDGFIPDTHGNKHKKWYFERPLPPAQQVEGNILILTNTELTYESLAALPKDFGEVMPLFYHHAIGEAIRAFPNFGKTGTTEFAQSELQIRLRKAIDRVSEVTGLDKEFINETLHGLSRLQYAIYSFNCDQGWWDNDREDGSSMMLIVSEIAEAMEGNRRNRQDDHLPHLKNEPVELADGLIRILDYAGRKNFDLSGTLIEKWAYNIDRADHKKENREKDGGKKY